MSTPKPASTVRKTPNFDFLFGQYSHSTVTIPYFQVSMTFADAANYLHLVSEMPGSSTMEWRLEELFQRDIDWPRVERSIVPYLRQDNYPQFFNALTIALLPFDSTGIREFQAGWKAPNLESEPSFAKCQSFGPLRCGFWQEWSTMQEDAARLGQLAWNTHDTTCIAIDGQHRLAAIKRVIQGAQERYAGCSIPVIFVVLDPELGYTGECSKNGIIKALRRLFTDLNKHAKVPSRARQILLDDWEPASNCVRMVVGEQLHHGKQELVDKPKRLPLTLVDWHSEQAKFDFGPYVTTVLGVDWAVAKLLRIGPMQDMMAFDAIDRVIGTLETRLTIDLGETKARLDEHRRYERPFAFNDSELDKIKVAFSQSWANSLIILMTGLRPYKELIDLRDARGTLTPEFANWYALKQKADDERGVGQSGKLLEHFEREISSREQDPIAPADFRKAVEAAEALKARHGLGFTVVFQRALILALSNMVKLTGSMVNDQNREEISGLDELLDNDQEEESDNVEHVDIRDQRSGQLVESINELLSEEPGFLDRDHEFESPETGETDRFWIGSFVQLEGGIDFTQSASSRGSDILTLCGLFWILRHVEGVEDFETVWARVENANGGIDLKVYQCVSRLMTPHTGVAARILRARDEEDAERARLREVRGRLSWLWARFAG